MVKLNYFQDMLETLPQETTLSLPVCKENVMKIKFEKNQKTQTLYNDSEPPLPLANSKMFFANISCWRRLTALDDGCKPVYEVTFDVKDSNFSFQAGDTIGIVPKNDEADVNSILDHLDLTSLGDLSYTLSLASSLKSNKIPAHIPVKSSIRHVLTHCVDLRSVLKKLFLMALSRHTKDENERRILEYFCSKEGSSAYQTHILEKHLCLLDLLAIFKTCKPSIQVLLAHLPRLLPRPYSIVNTGLKESGVLKICFSVMPLQNNRIGLTTGWLEKMILDEENLEYRMKSLIITNDCDTEKYKVPIYLRKNLTGFTLQQSMETPLILIGPGTGVSPFIGFLEDRVLYKENNPDAKLGDVWLFFGCRNPKIDFIYEKELNGFVTKGVLTKLCTAFSRVENNGVKYIQDALRQNSEVVTHLIELNASIYVCGDLRNIAAQVKDAITQCLVTSGKSLDQAKKVISDMQNNKKYVIDAWS